MKEKGLSLLAKATNVLAITGAGMSTTGSGIPDFRSKTGIYQVNPETILSRKFFFEKPGQFYDFVETSLYYPEAAPNEGHRILARWEHQGVVSRVITQNIDGLHKKAGSKKITEFHGSIETATCTNPKCHKRYSMSDLLKRKQTKERFWECDCGVSSTKRYIKPDFVLFGDVGKEFSGRNMHMLRTQAWRADLLLVLGTTLQVYPFNEIVRHRNKTIPMVIVNQGTTPFDKEDNVCVVKEELVDFLVTAEKSR